MDEGEEMVVASEAGRLFRREGASELETRTQTRARLASLPPRCELNLKLTTLLPATMSTSASASAVAAPTKK